jgi:hypothetical protein
LLDASGSTTTNGLPLTFSWTQVSGPTVTIVNPNTAALNLAAAEVAADSVAQFRVTVTAGTSSASATVNVTFSNIAQTPAYGSATTAATATFNFPVTAILGDPTIALAGVANTSSDPIAFVGFTAPGGQLQINPNPPFAETFTQPAAFEISRVYIGSDPISTQVATIQENENRYRIFRKNGTGAFPVVLDKTVERPCATTYPRLTFSDGLIYIGQRGKGLSVFTIANGSANTTFDASLLLTVGTTQSFCAILAPASPLGGSSFGGGFTHLRDLIAVDTDTNTISVFTQTAPNTVTYTLKQQVPVQLNSAQPLRFVAAAEVGGFFDSVAGLALVYTDGVHNGQHRLVVVGFDGQHDLVQETHSWSVGVPADVIGDNLDRDTFPEVVVIPSTSPQAIIFESTAPSGGFLPLSGPSYLEIGLGARMAIPAAQGVLGLNGLYVAYPERRQVRLFAVQ